MAYPIGAGAVFTDALLRAYQAAIGEAMQRLFVMFPDRVPGVGLLWLRAALAASVCWPWPHAPGLQWLAAAAAVLLLAGWLTPLAVLLAAASLGLGRADLVLAVLPACLLLLGPGAYSLDACLFGRRVLVRRGRGDPPKE